MPGGEGPLRFSERYSRRQWLSDTRSIQVVSFQLRVHYMIVSVALMSFDLGSLCWLTFNEESTDCGKTSRLVKAQYTVP